jgi:hypothetical protein
VILESGERIDFTEGNPHRPRRSWIEARGGARRAAPGTPEIYGGAGGPGVVQLHVPHPERAPGDPESRLELPLDALDQPDPLASIASPRPYVLYPRIGSRSLARSRWIPLGAAGRAGASSAASTVALFLEGLASSGPEEGRVHTLDGRVAAPAPLLGPIPFESPGVRTLGRGLGLSGAVLDALRTSPGPLSRDIYLRTPALLQSGELLLTRRSDPTARRSFAVVAASYASEAGELALDLATDPVVLLSAVQALGGPDEVELALLPRFFRLRTGPFGADQLSPEHSVRILFQGAEMDALGDPVEEPLLLDWTADPARFLALEPGRLAFLRFQVEFERDLAGDGLAGGELVPALEFLRLPFRYGE